MSYDDLKVIEAEAFVRSIASGQAVGATIADGVAAALVLEAIVGSSASAAWTAVEAAPEEPKDPHAISR